MLSIRDWMKGMALFYLMILFIISIPIIVVLLVLGIKTVFSLRYWIIAIGLFMCCFGVFILYRRRRRYKKILNENKQDILNILEYAMKSGQNVDISFMGGLVKISYKASNSKIRQLSSGNKEVSLISQPINNN